MDRMFILSVDNDDDDGNSNCRMGVMMPKIIPASTPITGGGIVGIKDDDFFSALL